MVRKDTPEEKQAYDQLLKACLSLDSAQDEKKLSSLRTNFAKLSQDLHRQVAIFQDNIANTPLSSLVLLWAEVIRNDQVFGKRYLAMMRELIEAGLLLLASKNKTVTLRDLSLQDPSFVMDRIRCHKHWSLHKREDHILLYKTFSEWLSKESFGYIPEAKDLDRISTQKRQVPFETYIEMLSRMDLREQILSKMFYLGGPRALEEIISLKIEDIDFDQFFIRFPESVSYPSHLFEDIKQYVKGRQAGFVFMGRDGERISHTTPFRALKTVVAELKLDPEFTFREFTKNG